MMVKWMMVSIMIMTNYGNHDDDDDDDGGNDHYHDFVFSHNYSLGHLQFWICILFMGHAYPRIIATITSNLSSVSNQESHSDTNLHSTASILSSSSSSSSSSTSSSSSISSSSSSLSWIQQWFESSYEIQGFYPLRLDMIYDHYLQLISISIVFTMIFSIYL
jgi:hypothetical protein